MLEANEISFTHGQRKILDRVSLKISPGEFLVIAGVNGAGKSTLLKLLSGALLPSEGCILLDGKSLSNWTIKELATRRSVLAQDDQLEFPFKAADVVAMGGFAHHEGYPTNSDLHRAMVIMESLDVAHLANRTYTSLSGGERSRIQLARALFQLSHCRKPPILLLDEPTASLDLGHQQTALKASRDFVKETGGSVIAILHDLNLAAQYADRIALLRSGRIFAVGIPERVLCETVLGLVYETNISVIRHPRLDCPLVIP